MMARISADMPSFLSRTSARYKPMSVAQGSRDNSRDVNHSRTRLILGSFAPAGVFGGGVRPRKNYRNCGQFEPVGIARISATS
jgi:hypothetical protein